MTTEVEQKILDAISGLSDRVDKLDRGVERFNDRLETYQKASDRVANLAFTVVTASAAAVVVLAPVVKVATDIAINLANKLILLKEGKYFCPAIPCQT